jgi:hypothetical protein
MPLHRKNATKEVPDSGANQKAKERKPPREVAANDVGDNNAEDGECYQKKDTEAKEKLPVDMLVGNKWLFHSCQYIKRRLRHGRGLQAYVRVVWVPVSDSHEDILERFVGNLRE